MPIQEGKSDCNKLHESTTVLAVENLEHGEPSEPTFCFGNNDMTIVALLAARRSDSPYIS